MPYEYHHKRRYRIGRTEFNHYILQSTGGRMCDCIWFTEGSYSTEQEAQSRLKDLVSVDNRIQPTNTCLESELIFLPTSKIPDFKSIVFDTKYDNE